MEQSSKFNNQQSKNPMRQVDQSVLTVCALHDESDAKAFWLSQTLQQRLQAIEFNRRTVYGDGDQEASDGRYKD